MSTDYFEVLRKFFNSTISVTDGLVKIDNKAIENLCNTLLNFDCLIEVFQQKVEDGEDRDKFVLKFNWLYNQLTYVSIHNTSDSTAACIKKIINLMIERTLKVCPYWFQQLLDHQTKVLEIFDYFHLYDSNNPIRIEFAGSDNCLNLPFTPIVASNQHEFEIIACFVMDSLKDSLGLFSPYVMERNIPFARLATAAFKCIGITGKVSALGLLTQYFEVAPTPDSIEIITNIMEGLSRYYQTLHISIKIVPTDREFYSKIFAPAVVKFCNTLMTARKNNLNFKSPAEQKIFTSVMLDTIYHEFKFSKVESYVGSMITKLVETLDFILYRSDFSEDSLMMSIKSFMLRFGYDISEVFYVLKYVIILEIEKLQNFNRKVTDMSESWKVVHDMLLCRIQESTKIKSNKYQFFSSIEWINNTLSLALQIYDFFTYRHQHYHLSQDFCKKCQVAEKLPNTTSLMNFNTWNYQHIHLDFINDIQQLAQDLINCVKNSELMMQTFEIFIELFTTILELSIDAKPTLTNDQKVIILSVLFAPFIPMMNAKDFNMTKEYKELKRLMPVNVLQFISSRPVDQLINLKMKVIATIPYLRLSKIGSIGSWLVISLTKLMFREKGTLMYESFGKKFKDLLISNGDVINQLLCIYKENIKTWIGIEWILCLQDKNVIVVKRTSPPNFSKALSYDVFCESCKERNSNISHSDRILTRINKSNGYVVSISAFHIDEKIILDYKQVANTPESHKYFIRSLNACMNHSKEFPKFFELQNGQDLLKIILQNDESVLFYTNQCLDVIIKNIIKNQQLSQAAKIKFFDMLYTSLVRLAQEALRLSLSLEIQNLYLCMITTMGCNAKYIPLEKEVLCKSEIYLGNCFMALASLNFEKNIKLKGLIVEYTIKMFKTNGVTLSKMFQWHNKLISGICELCLIQSIDSGMPFYVTLRNFLLGFGIYDVDSFLKRNINIILTTIFPFCFDNDKLEIIASILEYLDIDIFDTVVNAPLMFYKMIFEAPKEKRTKYQKYIETKGNFKYDQYFREEKALVIMHTAVYHSENENLFNDVLQKVLGHQTKYGDDVVMIDYAAMTKFVVEHFLGIMNHMSSLLGDKYSDRKHKRMAIRSIGTLLHFIGDNYASDLCFKVMGLLKSTGNLKFNSMYKKDFLNTWDILVHVCHPGAIGPFLSGIFVALEPFIEDYPQEVDKICFYLIGENQSILGRYFADLFFIERTRYPEPFKQEICSFIQSQSITSGGDSETQLKRIIKHMKSESADSDIKNYCLQYLHEYSNSNRCKINELIFEPKKNEVKISEVISVLLNCCRNKSSQQLMLQAAKCFGEIGAIKPDFGIEDENKTKPTDYSVHSNIFALHALNLLCKDYKDLHQSDYMEVTAASIQAIIKDRKMKLSESDPIYKKLSATNKKLIKPFFGSRYMKQSETVTHHDCIFWQRAQNANTWANLIATLLIESIENPETYELLGYLIGSMNHNNEICAFLLPYVFLHYFQATTTSDVIDVAIKRELSFIFEVIRDESNFKSIQNLDEFLYKFIPDYYFNTSKQHVEKSKIVQSPNEFMNAAKQIAKLIFEVMDFLTQYQNQSEDENLRIKNLLNKFHQKNLAKVSYNCGDYQRALIHYETYLGNLDEDERENEWAFLVHIFAALGDNDDIAGVADKRKYPWSANDKMVIGKLTGNWEDHTVCIEEIIHEPKNISVEVIASTVKCLTAYNNCEQAIVVADKMLEKLYGQYKNQQDRCEDVKFAALIRLSRFDELKKIVDVNSAIDVSKWENVEAKLLLKMRSQEGFNEEINQVRLMLMENFKYFESNESNYRINYDSIIHLHMLTDVEKTNSIIQKIIGNANVTKKVMREFFDEIEARKKFLMLSPMQSGDLFALHRTLFNEIRHIVNVKMSTDEADDLFKLIDSEIGRTWMEQAIVYQDQHEQANAFLIAAEKYKPPGLFIQKAKLAWRTNKGPSQAIKILKFHCDQIEKENHNYKDDLYYAKGLLLIARYNGDAAAVDFQTNKQMYKKALTATKDLDKAYLHYAEYLDKATFQKSNKEPDVNSIDVDKIKELLDVYGSGLLYSSEYVFQALPRFLQIWFDATIPKIHHHNDMIKRKSSGVSAHNSQINDIVKKFAIKLKPFQFYTAFSQLISRICHPCPEVYGILKIIISKLIDMYPRHSLWYVVQALKSTKIKLASSRMNEIFKMVPKHKGMLTDFEVYINHMIEISRVQQDRGIEGLSMKVNTSLGKIKSKLLMPLQHNLQILNESVMNNLTDDDQIFIYKMNDNITILKSMQKPKKVSFVGSNGQNYILMVKAQDDLRIDFRFMEFCKVLNDYFRKDRNASQRFFSIRTYSVSPINEEVGMIEWLQNMDTLKNIIYNQYNSSKIKIPSYRELKVYYDEWKKVARDKIPLQRQLEKRFPPILGRWYQNTFSCQQSYFSARNHYIKSTAVMSVVGYLFGLGDRHLENILVDLNTGEIAHVDFNSMFNASEGLPVPETVPFRLTQSLIEAMGVLGTEGSFRKCCEITMRLLQHRKNVLVAYLRPFVSDPLIQNFSQDHDQAVNNASTSLFAINNIKKKLNGIPRKYQHFLDISLSPEGHVKYIIDEAKNPANLSVMYFYWSPYI